MQDPLTEQIIGAAIEVHKHLGPGLLGFIYKEALCYEFSLRDISFERQVGVDVVYKDKIIKGQRIDILVANEVVVELKSVSKLRDIFIAIFDVEINSGYLKKTEYFLSQNANLMVSHTKQQRANKFKYDNWIS